MSDTRDELLAALAGADGPLPGPELAATLGVSRAAVWSHVEGLRKSGFEIDADPDGYVLADVPEYGGRTIALATDAPYEIDYHDSVASTNDRARTLAAEGEDDVAVVVAEQTGGRGRLDREWAAPRGGVYVSVLFRPDCPPAHAPAYTLAAAAATCRICREAGVDARIKWPNDVILPAADGPRGGGKLAGILTEMEGESDRVSWLVVGVGVNANVDPDGLPRGATSLRAAAGDVDRRRFLARVLESFHGYREAPESILPDWRELAATLGRRVRVETPQGTVEGEAVDVRFPGALIVATDDGEVAVHAGDCDHLRPAVE